MSSTANGFKLVYCVLLFLGFSCDTASDMEEEPDSVPARTVEVSIDTNSGRAPISPYIYGTNQSLNGFDGWTVRRLGGNRLTGYNWENDYSNAGSDWMHSSDTFMLSILGLADTGTSSARVVSTFHDQSLQIGAESIVTLQMAGYVAADLLGEVSENQTAPSNRWKIVQASKGAPFDAEPVKTDDFVYMDELVHTLVNKYGSASSDQGVKWYALDNEPALWAHTHPRIHPDPLNAVELVDRSIELALAVKAVDPDAKIMGPALYGFAAFESLQEAPDWDQEKTGRWFIDYYLDRMREAEMTHGMRLLDALDLHWYPEAQGDNRIVFESALTQKDVEARLQAPRTLWDASYVEDSWIGQWKQDFLPLLPAVQQSIDTYYPGTQLAITEYHYGASSFISGGLAQADVLGVFGTLDVDLATLWQLEESDTYISAAFNLYRNYDGNNGHFGSTRVDVDLEDKTNNSVYAAIHGEDPSQLHVIVINKSLSQDADFEFEIASGEDYTEVETWFFDVSSPFIQRGAGAEMQGNTISYRLPAMTAAHFIVK